MKNLSLLIIALLIAGALTGQEEKKDGYRLKP